MKAAKDTVVSFHYRLMDKDGTLIEDSASADKPPLVLLGHSQLVPGVEAALEGHESGDTFEVEVPPDQAYGEHREGMIQRVPKKYFRNARHLKPGMTTVLSLRDGGQQAVTVHKLGMSTIDVDVNHPMAGKTLKFAIEVLDVREATPEELAHGHAHPPGAHAKGEASARPTDSEGAARS
ncbi:MAG: peptidylprolyl isomerase [Rhodanobacteraceae bacterium]